MQIANHLFFAEIEQLLAEGSEAEFRLNGNSMRPLLRNGRDVVVIAPVATDTVAVGDVVLFRYHGKHILHRIIKRSGEKLLLAGDGNYCRFETATTHEVIGRLVRVRRPSGKVIDCTSRAWQRRSNLWLALPPMVRRIILGIARRLSRSW